MYGMWKKFDRETYYLHVLHRVPSMLAYAHVNINAIFYRRVAYIDQKVLPQLRNL